MKGQVSEINALLWPFFARWPYNVVWVIGSVKTSHLRKFECAFRISDSGHLNGMTGDVAAPLMMSSPDKAENSSRGYSSGLFFNPGNLAHSQLQIIFPWSQKNLPSFPLPPTTNHQEGHIPSALWCFTPSTFLGVTLPELEAVRGSSMHPDVSSKTSTPAAKDHVFPRQEKTLISSPTTLPRTTAMVDSARIDPATAIAALRETRPPVTDPVTYLVMIENNFIPEILPTLQEILQDAELTQEIGWDLVHKLATVPGPESDACLETIARLGNPRDVILKVSETLLLLPAPHGSDEGEDGDNGMYSDSNSDEYSTEDSSGDSDVDSEEFSYNNPGVFSGNADRYYLGDADDEHRYDDNPSQDDEPQHDEGTQQDEESTQDGKNAQGQTYDQGKPILVQKVVTLLGMLSILHQRLKTKRPSRFLAETLQTVHTAYLQHPTPEITAAVINLVHSLSGRRRPALPSRKSSINVANMDAPQQGEDQSSRNAPDPEDEGVIDQADEALQQRMLLSFVTCVLERYVNEYDVAWAGRLLEFYEPTKIVPRRQSLMGAFREEQHLQERDAVVGQLAVSFFPRPFVHW